MTARRRRPCRGDELPPWVVPISLPTPYPVGPVTVYLLEREPLTLIDTGPATRVAWSRLERKLAARGVRPPDLRRVLLTHGHHDHFGQAARLGRLGAEVLAHPHDDRNLRLERDYRRRWRHLVRAGLPLSRRLAVLLALRWLDRTTRPLDRFTPLADEERLVCGGATIRVHHTPGHSPGHVAFELEGEGVVISGDSLLDGITPNAVVDIDPVDPTRLFLSVAAYAATLDRLERLDGTLLLPAHGRCLPDAAAQVATVRKHQAQRAAQVLGALATGGVTVAGLVDRLFPHVNLLGTFLAYSEVLGHLLELERRGRVERHRDGRIERWTLVD